MTLDLALTLISLLGLFSISQKAISIDSAFSPVFTIPSLALILYVSALFGHLLIVASSIYYVGLVGFLLAVFFSVVHDRKILLNPTYIVFTIFMIFLFLILRQAYFHEWDEFQFWGTVSKYIYEAGKLPSANISIGYKDYPLGVAIFHSLIYTSFGAYSERIAYFAQDIFLFSPLLLFFYLKPVRKAVLGFVMSVFIMSLYAANILHLMYVDSILSVYFAAVLAVWFYSEKSLKTFLLVTPTLLFLPIIKQVGLLLALIASLIIFTDVIILCVKNKTKGHKAAWVIIALLIPLSIIGVQKTWQFHYQKMGVQKTFQTKKITTKLLASEFSSSASKGDKAIESKFVKATLFTGINRLHMSSLFQLILFIVLSIFLVRTKKDPIERVRYKFLLFYMFVGFLVYSIGLVILYMNSFAEFEGLQLASFGRYMDIYFLAYALILQLLWSKPFHWLDDVRSVWFVGFLVTVFTLFVYFSKPSGMKGIYIPIVKLAKSLRPNLPYAPNNLFIVDQNNIHDDGYAKIVMAYELVPRTANNCASFGKPYGKADHWTCDVSLSDFKQAISKVHYVLLMNFDHKFWRTYGSIFLNGYPGHAAVLYKVLKDGKLKLIMHPDFKMN